MSFEYYTKEAIEKGHAPELFKLFKDAYDHGHAYAIAGLFQDNAHFRGLGDDKISGVDAARERFRKPDTVQSQSFEMTGVEEVREGKVYSYRLEGIFRKVSADEDDPEETAVIIDVLTQGEGPSERIVSYAEFSADQVTNGPAAFRS